MKNLKTILLGTTFLSLVLTACKRTDQSLLNSAEQNAAVLEKAVNDLKENSIVLGSLTNQLDGLPEKVKNHATGYSDLKEKANSISSRIAVRTYEYDDLAAQMRSLAADYTAGKIKTADLKSRLESFGTRISDAPGFVENVKKALEEIKTGLLKFN